MEEQVVDLAERRPAARRRVIWKFPLSITETRQTVQIPPECGDCGALAPLAVKLQGYLPAIWAVVDPTAAPRPYEVVGIFTGDPMPEDLTPDACQYLGTVDSAGFIIHYFGREL